MAQQVTSDMLAAGAAVANIGIGGITSNEILDGTIAKTDLANPMTQATAQNSTAGLSIDFTAIPSWAKRITVIFNGVSTSGTANPIFQLGTGGVPTTTGYLSTGTLVSSTSSSTAFTAGFGLPGQGAATVLHGSVTFHNITGNTWIASGTFAQTDAARNMITAGSVSLAGVLNFVRITTSTGADTFDAGSINIFYE